MRDALMKVMIFRHDKQRAVKIVGDITQDAKLGDPQRFMQTVRDETCCRQVIRLSSNPRGAWAGHRRLFGAILFATFLTLLTHRHKLESFAHVPCVTTLPWTIESCGPGLTGSSASIFVQLGVVMLIGVVVNPAILIATN